MSQDINTVLQQAQSLNQRAQYMNSLRTSANPADRARYEGIQQGAQLAMESFRTDPHGMYQLAQQQQFRNYQTQYGNGINGFPNANAYSPMARLGNFGAQILGNQIQKTAQKINEKIAEFMNCGGKISPDKMKKELLALYSDLIINQTMVSGDFTSMAWALDKNASGKNNLNQLIDDLVKNIVSLKKDSTDIRQAFDRAFRKSQGPTLKDETEVEPEAEGPPKAPDAETDEPEAKDDKASFIKKDKNKPIWT